MDFHPGDLEDLENIPKSIRSAALTAHTPVWDARPVAKNESLANHAIECASRLVLAFIGLKSLRLNITFLSSSDIELRVWFFMGPCGNEVSLHAVGIAIE
jgi:hypothetical protein